MSHLRPRTKASRKRMMRVKEARRAKVKVPLGIPVKLNVKRNKILAAAKA